MTTEIAVKVGVYFWNYPKFLAEITFQDQGDNLEVTLKEEGRLILKMFARKLAAKRASRIQFHTYSIKEDVVMHALADGLASRFGAVMMGNVARLELGEHRISNELAYLELSAAAHRGQYTEQMMTKLYDPDQKWNVNNLALIGSGSQ